MGCSKNETGKNLTHLHQLNENNLKVIQGLCYINTNRKSYKEIGRDAVSECGEHEIAAWKEVEESAVTREK